MSQNRKQYLFYKNGQLASQIASDHAVTVLSVSNTLLAEQRSEGRSARISLLAVDLQSSVLNNSHRDSTHALAYTAYGHSKTRHGTASLMGFTGQRYDDATNCYLLGNGYRAYNPRLSRFLSADSLSPFTTRTHNAYAYCLGDPVNRHDPSGHMFSRIQQKWKTVKATFSKPRIHYIDKARDAIAEHPELEKYSVLVDADNVTIGTLKAIYKKPKLETMRNDYQAAAEEKWRKQKGDEQGPLHGPINYYFDHSKYLEIEEGIHYAGIVSMLDKFERRLDGLTPPHTARSEIRHS
jgi:RHS repeat-associated protein